MIQDLERKLNQIKEEKETKILPENIREGVTIFGVTGELKSSIDSSDATATAKDIKSGTTAYTANGKETGTLTFDKFDPDYLNCLNIAKYILNEKDTTSKNVDKE